MKVVIVIATLLYMNNQKNYHGYVNYSTYKPIKITIYEREN